MALILNQSNGMRISQMISVTEKAAEHIAAKKASMEDDDTHHPYTGKTLPKATLYPLKPG